MYRLLPFPLCSSVSQTARRPTTTAAFVAEKGLGKSSPNTTTLSASRLQSSL